ncbi:putative monocarboxylate permease [Xylariomycetidae sp. FL2044]|nr:putative monocarboxylate permease [Xylariomycetidae sp. FL2044]
MGSGQERVENSDTDDLERSCQNEKVTSEPPDGGFVAWMQVLCMHLVFFNTWGVANGYGVFQQYYLEALHRTESTISWIGSVQVFLLFFIGIATGRATDAGYFLPLFATGVFLQLLGLFMTSLATEYYQIFLAQAVCLGIGNGCTFCPALAVLSQYFKRNRAFSIGLAASGAAVGGLVYPVILDQLLFHRSIGFGWTLRVMGLVMLVTYLPCLVWLRPRLPPRKSGPWIDVSAFTELPFVLFSLGFFFIFWGLYFAFFYLGTFAREQLGVGDTIYLLMILNGVGIVGRTVPGVFADRWVGALNAIVVLSAFTSVSVYCWAAVSSVGGLLAFTVCYGLLAASLQSLLPSAATTMTPDPSQAGARIGMILGFVGFANLTGPAICGALIRTQHGSYLGAQMFAATSILIGTCMIVATRIAKTGLVLRVKI